MSEASRAQLAHSLPVDINVRIEGWISTEELGVLYASSDCLISMGERAGG